MVDGDDHVYTELSCSRSHFWNMFCHLLETMSLIQIGQSLHVSKGSSLTSIVLVGLHCTSKLVPSFYNDKLKNCCLVFSGSATTRGQQDSLH